MMRIAIGIKYFDPPSADSDPHEESLAAARKRMREVVLVGNGDRYHLDQLIALTPEVHREAVTAYAAPLLEGKEPEPGIYRYEFIAWWKRVEVLP